MLQVPEEAFTGVCCGWLPGLLWNGVESGVKAAGWRLMPRPSRGLGVGGRDNCLEEAGFPLGCI